MKQAAHRVSLMALMLSLVGAAPGCAGDASEPSVALPDPIDVTGAELDGVSVAPLDGIDGPSLTDCDPDALRVRGARPWTGGGVQVVLELLEAGEPVEAP